MLSRDEGKIQLCEYGTPTPSDSQTIFNPEDYRTSVRFENNNLSDEMDPGSTHHYLSRRADHQDELLAAVTIDGILWTSTDHLGSIRDVLGDDEIHLIYDAFGNLVSGINPILCGYTGKAFDVGTAHQSNIHRWCDASVGRWLSVDPIRFEGNDTNLYRYVKSALINRQVYPPITCRNPIRIPILLHLQKFSSKKQSLLNYAKSWSTVSTSTVQRRICVKQCYLILIS